MKATIVVLISFVFLSACQTEDAHQPEATTKSAGMPHLELVWQIDSLEGVYEYLVNIAVSSDGWVLAPFDGGELAMLIAIDSSGTNMARFGRFGEGPGELQRAGTLFSDADSFFVVSPGRAVVSAWSSSGKFLAETPLGVGALAGVGVGVTADAIYLVKFEGKGGGVSAMVRQGRLDNVVHSTLDLNTGFAGAAALASGPTGLYWPPPFTPYKSGFVIGNGSTYQLARYDAAGKELERFGLDLPPRHRGPIELERKRQSLEFGGPMPGPLGAAIKERLDTLVRETVPHFGSDGLQVDGSGRLWVVSTANDSTEARVFSGDTFLGRLSVPCLMPRRGIAINGHWLALRCAPRSELDFPALQLYRIVEANP